MRRPSLEVQNLALTIEGAEIFRGISFEISGGEVALLSGSNGSGKTSLLNVVSGHFPPTTGKIYLYGLHVNRYSPYFCATAGQGLTRSYQGSFFVPTLNVLGNVLLGATRAQAGLFGRIFFDEKKSRSKAISNARALIDAFGLSKEESQFPGVLSTGQRKKMDLIRTLLSSAQLLLLDEPSACLDGSAREYLSIALEAARRQGRAILLVEHDISWVQYPPDKVVQLR